MTAQQYPTLVLNWPVSDEALAKLKETFTKVHYHPEGDVPAEAKKEADVWFSRWAGLPNDLKLEEVPKLQLLQLTSAGANAVFKSDFFTKQPKAWDQITVSTASGIHVYSIPQWIIGQTINLFQNIHYQHYLLTTRQEWPDRSEVALPSVPGTGPGYFSLRGKTAGMLGYGHIAREAARLFQAHGVKVIAANTRGEKSADTGYVVEGTGDKDGSIPSAYYSTTDDKAFKEFLSKTDILVASLPSTPNTQNLLKEEHLRALPKNAIFLNVGRGDLISSDDILAVLDSDPPHLLGVALDVTDPEPLPPKHPLFSNRRALITPHTSGDFLGYNDAAADLLIANVKKLRSGGEAFNKVDVKKGY